MNLLEMLSSAQGGGALRDIGQQFGLDQSQTQQAVKSLLPAISGGLKRNSESPEGLQSLLSALQKGQHAAYIDEPGRALQPAAVDEGNAILGHLLGSKDASRQVADKAAEQTGVGAGILKQMLPMVAAMAMGSLGKQTQEPSMRGLLSGLTKDGGQGGSAGLGPLAAMLDADGDGSVADDIMNLAGKFLSR